MTGPSLTEQLATRLARPVDAATRARARLHLLDWLGCVAGARRSAVAALMIRGVPLERRAALLGNVLEMDDVHRAALLHPGPVVWPQVVETHRKRTLGDALDAGVRGYEAMISIGGALDAHHYAHFHPTATAGVFGGAAVGASATLSLEQTVWAMGHAGSMAGGLWRMRHEASHTKQLHVLMAGARGAEAAWYARAGFIGPRYILEGEQGLFAAMCRQPKPERMFAAADAWRIHEVSFKPWAACRHAHPAIDAALELRATGQLGNGPIVVHTYRDALDFCDRPAPRSAIEAKFSLQHAVAIVAVRGAPTLADFELEAVRDASLTAARARIAVVEDAALGARYPAHFGARIETARGLAECADAWGDPEWPLSRGDVAAKAQTLMAWGGVTAPVAAKCLTLVLDADDGAPLELLSDALGDLLNGEAVPPLWDSTR